MGLVAEQNLGSLRQTASVLCDCSDGQNHVGVAQMNLFINQAQERMAAQSGGCEDIFNQNAIVGVRSYPMPSGFISAKLVLYNGTPLRPVVIAGQDFFSSGNTYADRYALFGTSRVFLLLGSLPPSATYPITVCHYREPYQLVNDGDQPDIPNRFRSYLADYAAAKFCEHDGNLADAANFMKQYQEGVMLYAQWVKYGRSRDMAKTVNVVCD